MSRFRIVDKKLEFDDSDGELSVEEAVAFSLMKICERADEIDGRLKGIEWALCEGELKVHRTQ